MAQTKLNRFWCKNGCGKKVKCYRLSNIEYEYKCNSCGRVHSRDEVKTRLVIPELKL